ncbi:MAG TPA: FliM/FliN family flagellar motor switch protein [Kofleriaceae bacterium]|nr:FliM/FliN family flagellar motor switch protein [Kofleriaceae bacterium]
MSQAPLDPAELEAIQAAMREASSAPSRSMGRHPEEVTPLALIVDDREAESARPAAMRIGERWVKEATARLKSALRADVEVRVAGAEILSGESLRDGLVSAWTVSLAVDGRPIPALLTASGRLLAAVAGALCGAVIKDDGAGREPAADDGTPDRPPSPATIRIFDPIGEQLAAALSDAWREEQSTAVVRDARADRIELARRAMLEADVVIALTMQITGATTGRLRLIARPATLVRPPVPIEAVPAAPGALEAALGRVPVSLRVELGRTRLTMREFEKLTVGAIITLPQFVDDPLPIECGGVIKAYGRPVVSRGVLAVQIDRVFTLRGKRAA